MNPYLSAVLVGVALAAVITGIQILGIWAGSVSRRRAHRTQWERERPFRQMRHAFDDAEFARRQLADINALRGRGLLTAEQAAEMSEPVRAELESAVARLDQARSLIDQIAARP